MEFPHSFNIDLVDFIPGADQLQPVAWCTSRVADLLAKLLETPDWIFPPSESASSKVPFRLY